jgi:NADH dehydrogenase
MTDDAGRHRVVVVGGGFGGLPAARMLGHRPVDVTLVDRRNHHLFQPLLYQVATGMLSPGQIAPPIRHVVRHYENVRVELAEVTGFDLDRRVVHATVAANLRDLEIPYDSLIVAAGVNQSYFGHDELARFAPGMKTIDDALELRRRIFGAFEMAAVTEDPADREKWLTVVIVGAGPTGVELAGQVRELAVRCLAGEFRTFEPASVRVLLLDGGSEPLATFGRLSGKATKELERLGVELRMGSRVVGVDSFGVDVAAADGSKSRIDAYTTIWAAGVQASPLAAMLAEASGAELDRAGRIAVLADLTLPGHPEVFAVGDMAKLGTLPGVAEVAMQGGLHAANTIWRRLNGRPARKFKYRDMGSVATIGRFRAIASVHRVRLSGFPGWMVWFFVHLAFINGFGDRFSTMLRWLRSMVGRARVEREFSTAHTGGDLSLPESVRGIVQPAPFPNAPNGAEP